MQRSIAEAEEQLERKMTHHTEWKVMEVHECLVTFELCARVLVSKDAEETVLAALFSTAKMPPPPPRDRSKRHRVRDEEESMARKKDLYELEGVRRALHIDKDSRQLRAIEFVARECSSIVFEAERSISDGVVFAEKTTEGVPTKEGASFGQPDLPSC
ncbi:hypothetical protein EJD97_010708 [Solanum chilense]|uniref:Uncharacterized protein n=1 Tax=Solanum chilense TaxID=4083 RepID=A0A6N2AHU6_SOLCI|nr:hypothetical protein EJD97_010708 [Solanum chilense]